MMTRREWLARAATVLGLGALPPIARACSGHVVPADERYGGRFPVELDRLDWSDIGAAPNLYFPVDARTGRLYFPPRWPDVGIFAVDAAAGTCRYGDLKECRYFTGRRALLIVRKDYIHGDTYRPDLPPRTGYDAFSLAVVNARWRALASRIARAEEKRTLTFP
jgi:hypothetical protein